ncbi:arrestin domain-containing protein 3-like [Homalodisca vitripennis]|uniref:arrestin domain-containing protein 3-like n=1 Tax=Homalodisca vitripennis TaxID=197043 RepID=UPI001EE9D4AF|nr:arrestin domain-containing protein 3-like [Homalodisca vitripennis]XP_046678780.1 arrestin domain-containing protein 3-like [Homalodisca vitripennis]
MGIEDFQILLDNPSGIYCAGSTISGKLKFYVDKPKKIRGVKIKIRGEANVSFWGTREVSRPGEDSKTEEVRFHASEEYFSTKYYLTGSSSSEMEILPGEYEHPFTTTLPPVLPSSFESEHGNIRYLIKAKVDIPWEIDDKVEKSFSIMTNVDLNYIAEAKLPVKQEVEKTFCCLWCRSGPLTMVLNLPYAGYVPGQNIPVILEVDNASDVDVENIVIKLQKILECKANVPEHRTKTDYENLVELSLGRVNARDSKTFTQQFSVPVVPVFNLQRCSIITCDYVFMVIAETGSCHSDLTDEVPVFLGTVPVYQAGGAPPPVDSSVPLQQSYNPTMPMTQPPFNPSMPTAQPPFNSAMPVAQPTFNSAMPMAQPPFNPSMPMPQPMPVPQNPSETFQMPSFNPSMPMQQPTSDPSMPLLQPSFNPSMPLPQAALDASNPSAESSSNYLTPLLPKTIMPTAPPPTQAGWIQ